MLIDSFADAAEVRSLNFSHWYEPGRGGVLHTKLWIVDGRHFYVGSANMDWRSLTQVQPVNFVLKSCNEMEWQMLLS